MTTRRHLLQGTAAAAAFLGAPSFLRAAPAPELRPPTLDPIPSGEIRLQSPNFSLKPEFKAGIRPHRTGGVCLKRKDPIETPNGKRFLIHNYGHSGAGITLSWGCASRVVEHVDDITNEMAGTSFRPSVAVLGAGIIGLTTATELRRKWPRLPIKIYAKTKDITKTTSYIAGGQFEPSQIHDEYDSDAGKRTLADYLTRSARRITDLNNSGRRDDFGIVHLRNFAVKRSEEFDDYTPRNVVGDPRDIRLKFGDQIYNGFEYVTWLMNPTMLMPTLVKELGGRAGVVIEPKTFESEQQIYAELKESIIVNCTGWGARKLFKDDDLHLRRGHLVILPNPDGLKYFIGGGCNGHTFYLFARQKDIVIGGTVIKNDDEKRDFFADGNATDQAIVDRILKNAKHFFTGHREQCVDAKAV